MRVLIVARCKKGRYAPFITEQVAALEKQGVVCHFLGIRNKGVLGYLKHYPELRRILQSFRPDIVHAHYGLCGMLATLQRKVPVVTTYHGSDINNPKILAFSRFAIRHSRFNVFVSQNNIDAAHPLKRYALIPCGINLEDYPIVTKLDARKEMSLSMDAKYVLFAGAFDNPIKNAQLAKDVVAQIPGVKLLELKGYNRHQVALLMQAVDALLMTSFSEGSPQVIKEAMASGCPIVSVAVGDVREQINNLDGCYIADDNRDAIVVELKKALLFPGRTKGRERIIEKQLMNTQIADSIINIYQRICR